MAFSVNSTGITLPKLADEVRSVDVFFGEDRVWSIDLGETFPSLSGVYAWPAPISPFLRGATEVSIKKSGESSDLDRQHVVFTDDDVITRVLDDEGIPLAINKWGRLGKTMEAGNAGVQGRILDRSEEVIAHLQDLGLRPFVVGGTLLGAVRDGALLPHDDDSDLAYLSEFTNPADVAREGFEVGHALQDLGYEVVRHSATHMQLYFRNEAGHLDHYVDVFSAFFTDDGHINQPFHVRGKMRLDQMLPFSMVTIDGREFPAPADPEHWLVINYDENWRTPIPGYRLHTPRPTIRRFQNWFGSFHFKRDFWNDRYHQLGKPADRPWRGGAEWILSQSDRLHSNWLIDLGCGAGKLSRALQRDSSIREGSPQEGAKRQVFACDYSTYALAVAGKRGKKNGFKTAHVNLYRTVSLGLPKHLGIDGPFDLVANHLFDVLGAKALPNAFRLVRMSLRSGGTALATLYGKPASVSDPADPTGQAISQVALAELAAEYGIDAECVPIPPAEHEKHRQPYGVIFTLNTLHQEEE